MFLVQLADECHVHSSTGLTYFWSQRAAPIGGARRQSEGGPANDDGY